MNIKELTNKMNDFVGSKGWYAQDSPKPQTPKNLAVSLNLEAAEVLEHFQWSDAVLDQKSFAGELADVALYLMQLAFVTGIDLEQAITEKLAQNHNRQWENE